MLRRLAPLPLVLLTLSMAACDYGSEGLVLDGTYRGTGQSQVAMGADPIATRLDVLATFTNTTIGALTTELRLDVTIGGAPETYTGRLTGTLSGDGSISFSGTLDGADNRSLSFNASGEASDRRIEVDVTGSFPVSSLILTRV